VQQLTGAGENIILDQCMRLTHFDFCPFYVQGRSPRKTPNATSLINSRLETSRRPKPNMLWTGYIHDPKPQTIYVHQASVAANRCWRPLGCLKVAVKIPIHL